MSRAVMMQKIRAGLRGRPCDGAAVGEGVAMAEGRRVACAAHCAATFCTQEPAG